MAKTKQLYCYEYYGLKVLSVFAFPELQASEFEKPDVTIDIDQLGTRDLLRNVLEGWYFESENHWIFQLENQVKIQVINGSSITVQLPKLEESNFHQYVPYLLGPVFNSLLHQRGISLFHASVVCKQSQCLAIAGASGAGKSTTAAELVCSRQFNFLSDDVCAVSLQREGQCHILPGAPRLKLLPEAFGILGIDKKEWGEGMANAQKTSVPVGKREAGSISTLHSFFILQENSDKKLEILPVSGIEKARLMLQNMIWTDHLKWMGKREKLFNECMSIAQMIKVYSLNLDKQYHSPRVVAQLIEDYYSR